MRAAGDRFALIQGLTVLAQSSFFRGRFAEAEASHRRAIALADEEGKVYRLTTSRALLACSLAFEGRPAEAAVLLNLQTGEITTLYPRTEVASTTPATEKSR